MRRQHEELVARERPVTGKEWPFLVVHGATASVKAGPATSPDRIGVDSKIGSSIGL